MIIMKKKIERQRASFVFSCHAHVKKNYRKRHLQEPILTHVSQSFCRKKRSFLIFFLGEEIKRLEEKKFSILPFRC